MTQTFGWQSGATGGMRTTDARGGAIWSANASGAVMQGAIGALSVARRGSNATCATNSPAFVLKGGTAANAFSLPISMAFRRGELINLSVVSGRFANGESLEVTTRPNRQQAEINGAISNGRTQVATFRTNRRGLRHADDHQHRRAIRRRRLDRRRNLTLHLQVFGLGLSSP